MSNMLGTIEPKTDQLNADSLVGGPRTIKITRVSIAPGEQPVTMNYEGDDGKPYKPGKSMRRVLINVWGDNGNAYVGRSLTIYCDPEVAFGGMKVGGIRISHMSHITKPVTQALTATRANRKPFTVIPLIVQSEPEIDEAGLNERAVLCAKNGVAEYQAFWKSLSKAERAVLLPRHDDLKAVAKEADEVPLAVTPADTAP